MSNNDSFVDEVAEELRRDRLYHMIRRYGWIAVVAVVGLVGGTAYFEYTSAQERSVAQAKGDAILTAMENNDSASRSAALNELPQGVVSLMLEASTAIDAGDREAAIAAYREIADIEGVDSIYVNVAAFKAMLLDAQDMTAEEKIAAFEPFTDVSNPLNLLALEQIALANVEAGEREKALEILTRIENDASTTRGLRDRAGTLIVSLGGDAE